MVEGLILERYRQRRKELDELAATLDELRQRLDGRTTASYASHVSRSGDGRGLEARAIHLADMETRYVDALDALAELRLEAETELARVPDNVREVLVSYYIDGMTVRAIAAKAGRTETYIFRLKATGLNHLREVMT